MNLLIICYFYLLILMLFEILDVLTNSENRNQVSSDVCKWQIMITTFKLMTHFESV